MTSIVVLFSFEDMEIDIGGFLSLRISYTRCPVIEGSIPPTCFELEPMTHHNDQSSRYDLSGVPMITETNVVAFRKNLGEMLNQVQYRHASVLISKNGKPVAALIDSCLFDRIRRLQDRFDALCQRVESGFEDVPGEVGVAEIHAAVEAERSSTRIGAK